MRTLRSLGPILLAVVTVVACENDGDRVPPVSRSNPIVPLDSGQVYIVTPSDTVRLSVEIAETPRQTQVGLIDRDSLPVNEGMFFLFPEPREPNVPFWMFRTRIPLDIAFLNGDGDIVAIRTMAPCTQPNPDFCPRYAPGVPYSGALEVNQGYFTRHGIDIGDSVILRR